MVHKSSGNQKTDLKIREDLLPYRLFVRLIEFGISFKTAGYHGRVEKVRQALPPAFGYACVVICDALLA